VANLSGGVVLKITVLLVEDSKFQKLTNERMLLRAGYTVLNASDGEEALRLARESTPDIILLDMLLPKLGGREVMLALRADASTSRIPVLFFSSLSQANEAKLMEGGSGLLCESAIGGATGCGRKRTDRLDREAGAKCARSQCAIGESGKVQGRRQGHLARRVVSVCWLSG
jgi:CheY-like chemotaxis protein